MKQQYKIYFEMLSIVLLLACCVSHDDKTSTDKWYEETKAEILKQADLIPDSINLTYNEDRTFKEEHYFSDGHEYLFKGYNNEILRIEAHYSIDGNFELRREICENGNWGFEGIVYKGNFYGLSTWRYCNGQIDHQGVRYNDLKIGIWKKFDETGKQIEESDYKNIEQLDSMPTITK